MREVQVLPPGKLGREFVAPEFLPRGKDEYYLRNEQSPKPDGYWRNLQADEIETLVRNGNTADDWDSVLVADVFTPNLVRGCEFSGLVRIGRLEDVVLEHHNLRIPAGLTNSRVISCDVGDNAAVHNVRYLAHYVLGDNVMLLNIDEMHTTDHAKFGNGIVKEGEPESVRIWLDVINETSGRAVLPFDGMTTGDAWLWARYRDDAELQARLVEMTQRQFDPRRGYYGAVGDACVIKNCRIIKDVKFGACCYVKGANKLKNLTVNSTEAEPSQIGEGVELVNGIIGLGCHIFYGCKAVRFVMGNNTNLKYGARLIHSVLGDNSTVSCCEILHNLVFPAHEQHHNNSFLTATVVKGQSNLAAGATVGSNHNSRANDGEIEAGRGFWPGLCVTLKHSSRFASFTLLAKGDYPAELNIPLPFSLVSDDETSGRLVVLPAFWWLYNMYALARNTWKFTTRDKRKTKTQHIEFDSLAPDTAEELFAAMRLLEVWAARAALRAEGKRPGGKREADLARKGRELLLAEPERTAGLEVLGEGMEKTGRPTLIARPREAYHAYRQMLHYYAMKNLLAFMDADKKADLARMRRALGGRRESRWDNVGGQLVPQPDVEKLLERIRNGRLKTWRHVHEALDTLWEAYPRAKQRHAYRTLLDLHGWKRLTAESWREALDEAVEIQAFIRDQVYLSRKKDYENPFRQATFRNAAEMEAVVGTAEGNSFVKQVREETEAFKRLVRRIKRRG